MSRAFGRVLIVEDDDAMAEMLTEALQAHGHVASAQPSVARALSYLEGADVDVVLTDLNMPGQTGLALCAKLREARPDVPVVVVTAFGSMATAVEAMRAGAWDFVTKPLDVDALALLLGRAVSWRRLEAEVRQLRDAVRAPEGFEGMVGTSAAMRRLYSMLERVATLDVTVLITGESGTGKELVAQALHRRSPRAAAPFVAVNCAAIPEPLLETELFGHVRGAFTDARSARTGLLFQAAGGTILLDEVGELPLSLQAKLLRALQERVARPVGGDHELPFDVRIVAATNRDLEARAADGLFRSDLYYRLNVVELAVPPLRQREGDLLLLAQHFLTRAATRLQKRVTGLDRAAAERLAAWSWPGNVRELQNYMERAVALARYDHVTAADLPDRVRTNTGPAPGVVGEDGTELLSMDEVERRHILRIIDAVGGSKTAAARVLGLDRATLYRKLDRYGKR